MSATSPIYLDGFATLPLAPEARAAMLSAWDAPGNGGSPNRSGERAAQIIDAGRASVARLIGAAPSEIIFTSGATEANNIAIIGGVEAARRFAPGRRRIIVSAIEHKSVLEPANFLAKNGIEVSIAKVTPSGVVDLEHLASLAGDDLLLMSVMMANNETGVIQPVAEVARMAHAHGAFMHCDAAQAAGKIELDVIALDVDYLSLSAHKCYGPMGIGALYVAAGTPVPLPLVHGGGQQCGVRPGTEPVALIAGFGAAAEAAREALSGTPGGEQLIAHLLCELERRQIRFRRVTGDAPVLPGGAAIEIIGADGDMLCAMIASEVSMSTGSACTSGQLVPSHVLDSMGISGDRSRSVVRLFSHRFLEKQDVTAAAEQIVVALNRSLLAAGDVRQ